MLLRLARRYSSNLLAKQEPKLEMKFELPNLI